MKKLGFGLMRMPLLDSRDSTSIDIEQMKKMVDMFIERGFTYFDTAWMYHDFKSEDTVKEVLTDRYPRDAYTLATKLHAGFFETKEDIENVFNTQLKKTGVEFFDYYLLHDMNADYYEKYKSLNCFEWIQDKKAKGMVKNIGFSFHDTPELLDKVLTEYPVFDFVQLQINYLDWDSVSIQSGRCYEVARKHDMPIVIMEPVKGGLLSSLPEDVSELMKAEHEDWSAAEWAIRFAAGLEGVMLVLSGMSSLEQLDDNTAFMSEFKELSQRDKDILKECVDIIESDVTVACTGCSYCTDGCAASIPIPTYFSIYNTEKRIGPRPFSPEKNFYKKLAQERAAASECHECGQCELICPQHLPVMTLLKDVAAYFEE